MEAPPSGPLYIMVLNWTNAEIHLPKHMVIYQSRNTLSTIVSPEVFCQKTLIDNQPKPNNVTTASTNLSKNPFGKAKQDETINSNWRNNLNIFEVDKEYLEAFLEMLELLHTLWDGWSRAINTANHRIELTAP